jgi:hypothetical protein
MGDLVGHLSNARGAEKRLDKATDKLFPASRFAEFSMKQIPYTGKLRFDVRPCPDPIPGNDPNAAYEYADR